MDPFITPYIKINFKYVKGLNTKAKTMQFLEENIMENLLSLDLTIIFGYESVFGYDIKKHKHKKSDT